MVSRRSSRCSVRVTVMPRYYGCVCACCACVAHTCLCLALEAATSLQPDVDTDALCVGQDNATTALWNAMVDNPMAVKDFNRLNGSQLLTLQLNTGTVLGKELAAGAIWKVCLFLCPHSYCCSCAHPYCMCGCICNATRARGGEGPDVRPLCRHLGRTVALRTFTFQIDVFLASKSCF